MPAPWSREENEATVSQYFEMLRLDLAGNEIVKAARHRALVKLLNSRNEDAVTYKHRNISAILVEAGLPFVTGYAPLENYQASLAEIVLDWLRRDSGLLDIVAADSESLPRHEFMLPLEDIDQVFVPPPKLDQSRKSVYEVGDSPYRLRVASLGVDYLEREARFRALGKAGEEFVVQLEQQRLERAGEGQLASKVEHVSRTRGDGLGYDVLSYEIEGRERLIEVKTTKHGKETPFFVSQNEVEVSTIEADQYHLYRVFDLRRKARVYTLPGALTHTCVLDPRTYKARVA